MVGWMNERNLTEYTECDICTTNQIINSKGKIRINNNNNVVFVMMTRTIRFNEVISCVNLQQFIKNMDQKNTR